MSELNTASQEVDQQQINPNQDIQSLVGDVDISAFEEKLSPILTNPVLKELLIKELKENQPITGGLVLNKIIRKIKDVQLEQKDARVEQKDARVEQKDARVEQKDVQLNIENTYRMDQARIATSEVNKVFSAFEKSSIPADKKTEISSRISSQLTDIKNGKIPDETKNFLNTIGANTPESIASPEVQSILTAHVSTRVYLENKDSILKTNPELGKQFDDLNRNKFSLGLGDKTEAKSIANLIPDQPKSDREAITSTVKSLTKDSPDTMITRTGDRLTFQDPKNERYTYDIDMAKRPLELSKQLGGLKISRELGETRDPIREKNDKIRTDVEKMRGGIALKKDEILKEKLKDGNSVVSEGFGGVVSNTLNQINTRDPKGAEFSRKMIESGSNVILMEKTRLEQLLREKTSKDNLDPDIGSIGGVIREIDTMIESMKRIKNNCIIEQEDPKSNHTLWEKNTNNTLRELVRVGFDELGQENLNTLIRGLSVRAGKRGLWESGKLDITDNNRLDQQVGELTTIVSNLRMRSGRNERETLQDIRKSIAGNEGFRNMWNNSESLTKFLEKKGDNTTTIAQNTTIGESRKNPL